jgi:hypothetical protein
MVTTAVFVNRGAALNAHGCMMDVYPDQCYYS